eukprot:417316-Pleurochrysis_carterae.AAC.1
MQEDAVSADSIIRVWRTGEHDTEITALIDGNARKRCACVSGRSAHRRGGDDGLRIDSALALRRVERGHIAISGFGLRQLHKLVAEGDARFAELGGDGVGQ